MKKRLNGNRNYREVMLALTVSVKFNSSLTVTYRGIDGEVARMFEC